MAITVTKRNPSRRVYLRALAIRIPRDAIPRFINSDSPGFSWARLQLETSFHSSSSQRKLSWQRTPSIWLIRTFDTRVQWKRSLRENGQEFFADLARSATSFRSLNPTPPFRTSLPAVGGRAQGSRSILFDCYGCEYSGWVELTPKL